MEAGPARARGPRPAVIVREGEPHAGAEAISGYDADDASRAGTATSRAARVRGRPAPGYLRRRWRPTAAISTPTSPGASRAITQRLVPAREHGWAPYSHGHWAWTPTDGPGSPPNAGAGHVALRRWGYNDGWFWSPGARGRGLGELVGGAATSGLVPARLGRCPCTSRGPREGPRGAARDRAGRHRALDYVPSRRYGPARPGAAPRRSRAAHDRPPTRGARGQARLRVPALVEGAAGWHRPAAAGGAVPATCSSSTRPGTPCPSCSRPRRPSAGDPAPASRARRDGGPKWQRRPAGQSGSRVSVPRAPRSSAPFTVPDTSAAAAALEHRGPGEHRAEVSATTAGRATCSACGRAPWTRSHARRAGARRRGATARSCARLRPPQPPEPFRRRGPRTAARRAPTADHRAAEHRRAWASAPERGSSEGSGSESGRSRPSGAASAPRTSPRPRLSQRAAAAQPPAEQRAQPRESAKPRDHN